MAASSSSQTPPEGDAESQLVHFINTFITPSSDDTKRQEEILKPFLDTLVDVFAKEGIKVRIVIAGSRMKDYYIKSRSDFDVLIVFEEGYPVGGRVELGASSSEYKILRSYETELPASDFYNKTITRINDAGLLLDNSCKISILAHPIPLNQLAIEIDHNNSYVECDILSVIPDPQDPNENFFEIGRASC